MISAVLQAVADTSRQLGRGLVQLVFRAMTDVKSALRIQVEYYLSDENLERDRFFRDLIAKDAAGAVDLSAFLQCNKIKQMKVSSQELADAIEGSEKLELRNGRVLRRVPFQPAKGYGKGSKGKDRRDRPPPVFDPSGPCGYFMAGYCERGKHCVTQHSVPYAMAIRDEWLHPADANARRRLQEAAAAVLGEEAGALFPRVFSHELQCKRPSAEPSMADLGFEWTEPEVKARRWSRRLPADGNGGEEVKEAQIRYVAVFDLEGKDEIIEFPVLLFDVVAGKELGRFQRFVRPAELFKGKEVSDTPAVPFPLVLDEFSAWLRQKLGKGLEEMGDDTIFMTCGDWDCKHVRTQCQICGVPTPWAFSRWINIKRSYAEAFGGDFRGMKSMLLGGGEVSYGHHMFSTLVAAFRALHCMFRVYTQSWSFQHCSALRPPSEASQASFAGQGWQSKAWISPFGHA